MKTSDIRTSIETDLKSFPSSALRPASLGLLATLGYSSSKQLELDGSPTSFMEQFHCSDETFCKKAMVDEWKEIQLLFQLTDQELSNQQSLFEENDIKQGLMQSYLFFAVRLKGKDYARGKLAQITRQLNKIFPMPVMVFFEYDEKLSIAVINRRRNKRDADKDVLGKVTLIQNISLPEPHRGHLDILASFSIAELTTKKQAINSFDALHEAWEEVFNVELLNKNFYRELSDWYFWAMKHVNYPYDQLKYTEDQLDKGDLFQDTASLREHDAKNLIRLLTRLLFVWFIKEKDLVPEKLFEVDALQNEILNDFDPGSSRDSIYYKAVLQNLFFASLNQVRGKREFRKEKQHHNTTNLMRYMSSFKSPEQFITLIESFVPFMNGGLFECLDKPHPTLKGPMGGAKILYEDGFSDRKDNPLCVPNELFFGSERVIDLSDVYGDKKRKNEKVRGIIHILNSYKFTIVENTPIEQEIALDPELLGKVFENLLASYNPETKTTARKQTGSFYTPRTIVDYMVDESLKAYFKSQLIANGYGDDELMTEALERLFCYTEAEHPFFQEEVVNLLIDAIDSCKILDPACGSGAFPMGVLHKLEFILGKLDPHNKRWSERQLEKVNTTITAAEQIDDATVRDNTIKDLEAQKADVEEAFANNELGYGRKLYLIENCIYGVDLQSIATQVSKLRFFISLIVDQTVNQKSENFGIRPLPNLEIKFVTADTLMAIEKPNDQFLLFDSQNIKKLQDELKKVRHNLFSAKTPKTKDKYRQRDKELRHEIAAELKNNGWAISTAHLLAEWDPYDQNACSPFFDPEWMFDLDGFDIVIGNPPYVQIQKFPKDQKAKWVAQKFKTYAATADIYCLFYERGVQLLKQDGMLCYITSNNWMRANYGKSLRSYFCKDVDVLKVLDFGMGLNFSAAAALTNILLLSNRMSVSRNVQSCYAADTKSAMTAPDAYFSQNYVNQTMVGDASWVIVTPERFKIKQIVEGQGVPLEKWDLNINYGIKTGLNDAFYLTQEQRDQLIDKEPHSADIIVPLLRGRFVGRYCTEWDGTWMIGTFPSLGLEIENYPLVKAYLSQFLPKLKQTGESFVSESGKKEKTRKKTQNEWFETQDSIAYHKEFLKPKIIYPNMTKYLPFYYDVDDHYYGNQKCFIITSDSKSLPYLIAILNSSLFKCCFRDNFPELLGNTYELSKVFFDKIPIRKPAGNESVTFETLISWVQTAKKQKQDVFATFLEELIDACVMELYFPEEAQSKDLQFIKHVEKILSSTPNIDAEGFYSIANESKHPLRNQLIRLTIDSPELFAVIKEEGKV